MGLKNISWNQDLLTAYRNNELKGRFSFRCPSLCGAPIPKLIKSSHLDTYRIHKDLFDEICRPIGTSENPGIYKAIYRGPTSPLPPIYHGSVTGAHLVVKKTGAFHVLELGRFLQRLCNIDVFRLSSFYMKIFQPSKFQHKKLAKFKVCKLLDSLFHFFNKNTFFSPKCTYQQQSGF